MKHDKITIAAVRAMFVAVLIGALAPIAGAAGYDVWWTGGGGTPNQGWSYNDGAGYPNWDDGYGSAAYGVWSEDEVAFGFDGSADDSGVNGTTGNTSVMDIVDGDVGGNLPPSTTDTFTITELRNNVNFGATYGNTIANPEYVPGTTAETEFAWDPEGGTVPEDPAALGVNYHQLELQNNLKITDRLGVSFAHPDEDDTARLANLKITSTGAQTLTVGGRLYAGYDFYHAEGDKFGGVILDGVNGLNLVATLTELEIGGGRRTAGFLILKNGLTATISVPEFNVGYGRETQGDLIIDNSDITIAAGKIRTGVTNEAISHSSNFNATIEHRNGGTFDAAVTGSWDVGCNFITGGDSNNPRNQQGHVKLGGATTVTVTVNGRLQVGVGKNFAYDGSDYISGGGLWYYTAPTWDDTYTRFLWNYIRTSTFDTVGADTTMTLGGLVVGGMGIAGDEQIEDPNNPGTMLPFGQAGGYGLVRLGDSAATNGTLNYNVEITDSLRVGAIHDMAGAGTLELHGTHLALTKHLNPLDMEDYRASIELHYTNRLDPLETWMRLDWTPDNYAYVIEHIASDEIQGYVDGVQQDTYDGYTFGAYVAYDVLGSAEYIYVAYAVPEPATLSLLALGSLALWRRRRI